MHRLPPDEEFPTKVEAPKTIWDTTAELKALRELCQRQESQSEATRTSIPEQRLAQGETSFEITNNIVDNLHFEQEHNIDYARSIINGRLERSLVALGINLENVTHWKVNDGTLVLEQKIGGATVPLGQIDLFPKYLTLKKNVIAKGYAAPNKDMIELDLQGKTPDVLLGSVDASTHGTDGFKEEWFAKKILAAKQLLKLYDEDKLLDQARLFVKKLEFTLRTFAALETADPDIVHTKFETMFAGKDLYGPYGIYNILLAYQRATYGRTFPDSTRIELRVGGKSNSPEDRYASAWTISEGDEHTKNATAPKGPEKQRKPEQQSVVAAEKEKPKPSQLKKIPEKVADSVKKAPRGQLSRPVKTILDSLAKHPDFEKYTTDALARYDLPDDLKYYIFGVMRIEAGFDPRASRGGTNAPLGLAQAVPETQQTYWKQKRAFWEEQRGKEMPLNKKKPWDIFFDPEISIDLIAWMIKNTVDNSKHTKRPIDLKNPQAVFDLYLAHNSGEGGRAQILRYMKNPSEENLAAMERFLQKDSGKKRADGTAMLEWEDRSQTARYIQKLAIALKSHAERTDTTLTGGVH